MGLLDVYTSFFTTLGLDSPWTRLIFGSAIGLGVQYLAKPSISYHKTGKPKTFKETLFPWYVLALVPGIIFSLFF